MLKADSQNIARRLSETPANTMTPTLFAQVSILANVLNFLSSLYIILCKYEQID